MTTRQFTREQLATLGVPPDSPEDVEYSDTLLADEPVTVLKYSQQRRAIFRAEDDGKAYAVTYEAPIDSGNYEVGGGPDNHGWWGDTVEAVEVEQRPKVITTWEPVGEQPSGLVGPYQYTDAEGDLLHISVPGDPASGGPSISFYTGDEPVHVPVEEIEGLIAAVRRLASRP
ncbi:hypothetical protein ACVHNB_32715 [Streptomyces sp. YJ-C3]